MTTAVDDDDDDNQPSQITITIDEFTLELKEAMQAAFDKAFAQRLIEKIFTGDDEFAIELRRRLFDAAT